MRGQDHLTKCNKHKGFACRKKQDHLKSDWITIGSPVDPPWIPHGSPLRNRLVEPPSNVSGLHAHAYFLVFQHTSCGGGDGRCPTPPRPPGSRLVMGGCRGHTLFDHPTDIMLYFFKAWEQPCDRRSEDRDVLHGEGRQSTPLYAYLSHRIWRHCDGSVVPSALAGG